jgi:hypothetical protein
MAGFQLLQLTDFPGQGSALIGLLNAFWESKGVVTPDEFSRFCGPTVPLARFSKRVWLSDETFCADILVSHYGGHTLEADCSWEIASGYQVLFAGELGSVSIPCGSVQAVGAIRQSLGTVTTASELTLTVQVEQHSNSWRFWVFPQPATDLEWGDVVAVRNWAHPARAALQQGKTVFLTFEQPQPYAGHPIMFPPAFWSPIWFKEQPGTMGLLCDPGHSAFGDFPTRFHSDWQWWDVVQDGKCYDLSQTPPGFRPLLQVIDRYDRNRKMAAIFEARVGRGKLLACFLDLHSNLDRRPAAQQLLQSLNKYVTSESFHPSQTLSLAELDRVFELEP